MKEIDFTFTQYSDLNRIFDIAMDIEYLADDLSWDIGKEIQENEDRNEQNHIWWTGIY